MNLEDNLGDIIRKARLMTGVGTEQAAKAAGIGLREFALMEEAGEPVAGANFVSLAGAIGLDGEKLKGIASGWLPAKQDLAAWRELRVLTTSDGGMAVNNFLVWDEVTREAALFDTGWNADDAFQLVEENRLQLKHVFITHSHEDHIAALPQLRERFPKARLHSSAKAAPVEQRNRPQDFIHLGSLRISNRDTPGHAADGTTYLIGNWPEDAPCVAIVGDAIFAGSMGRGNLSWDLARQKVREQILTLPLGTLLCPGHGPLTTVAEERAHNPFF